MPVFEVERRQLELITALPMPKAHNILELLFSEQYVENTSEHYVLHLDFSELFLNDLSLFLMLILHLKDFLRGSFVLAPQLDKLFPHFFNLVF